MKTSPSRYLLSALVGAAVLCGANPALAQKELSDYVQPGLKDLSATVAVVSKNDRELEKIGKSYVQAYGVGKQDLAAKEPGRLRYEARQGLLTFRSVTNGSRKLTEVGMLRVRKVEDLSGKPGKGDTLLDVGLITPSWLEKVDSRWLRTETRDGKALEVFEYTYKGDPDAPRTLWLDPATRTVVESVQHNRSEKPGFKKRIVYTDLKQVNGVWLPTRATMYNTENKVAGVLRYDNIMVNSGLPDNLFTF